MTIRIITLFLLAWSVLLSASGATPADSVRLRFRGNYEVEALGSLSSKGDHTPFWFISNRAGLGSTKSNTGFVRGAVHAGGDLGGRWSWTGGADLVGAWRSEYAFLVRELYGALRYLDFELTVGSKLENDRLVNMNLSSGDLLYSGNSVPVLQVKLSMPDYMVIPIFNRWFGFKAYFSFGKFTDSGWQKDFVGPTGRHYKGVYYHTKGFRLRIARPDLFPLSFEVSLEMAAQFGGKIYAGDKLVSTLPSSASDILHIIIPSGGGGADFPGEQSNVLGNHVGEWSARLKWDIVPGMSLSAYYLHYFEDHSMMFIDYVWRDGLMGLELTLPRNRFVDHFVYEFLGMKDQAGPVYWDHTSLIPEQVSGRDNYYNHYLYGGWQHWGMGIGNPLVISPLWNADGSLSFKCNRILSHHFGLSGSPCSGITWRALVSYTRGWGTYGSPYNEILRNVNLLGEISYSPVRLSGWSATLGIGLDRGGMIGDSFGAMLSIKKNGLLCR